MTNLVDHCPLIELAREFDRLIPIYNKLHDGHEDRDAMLVWRRMDAIREQASYLTPRSQVGAAFQVMLASALLDAMLSNGPDVENNDSRVRAEHDEARVQRLLHQAANFMWAGTTEMAGAREWLMGDHANPIKRLQSLVGRAA